MIAEILSIFTSAGFGAITGIAGAYLTKVEERKLASQNHIHEIALRELALRERSLELDHEKEMAVARAEFTALEGNIELDKGELVAFQESLKTSNQEPILIRLVRPGITLYLLTMFSILAWNVHFLAQGLESLDATVIGDMYLSILRDLTFLTLTAVLWWFGARPAQERKHHGN